MSKRYPKPPVIEADDVTSQIEPVLRELLSKQIVVPNLAEVRDYLLRYPDLIELLPAICSSAAERFGLDAQLSLEVYRDPEIEDEYLALYVRQENYDQHLPKIIEEISAEYEAELADKSGWLLITTDFHPPK